MNLNPYFSYDGTCEAAFRMYERVLGSKITAMMPYEGTPIAKDIPPEWQKKVIHARIQIGDQVIMGSDSPPGRYKAPQGCSICAQADTPADAERIFTGLSEGGAVQMPLTETFFAQKFGMFTDKFGVPWMVICEKPR